MKKLTGTARAAFHLRGLLDTVAPRGLYRAERELARLTPGELARAEERAEYYCRQPLGEPGETRNADFGFPREAPRHTAYFFPLRRLLNYFPAEATFNALFGDVNWEPERPTLVKSRPVGSTAGTLLPLDAVRHFRWVDEDPTPWEAKRPALVSRNEVHREPRLTFMERCFGLPGTDLGQVNPSGGRPELWLRERMTVAEQLDFRFIACIEGNDVATNLKWVMSSNSLPVMARPRMESWFMEGTLRAGEHYVALADDYSDLAERMEYYLSHPAEAREIIANNHERCRLFRNPRVEHAALLTLRRYLGAEFCV